jgi:hypothetical protein
MKQRGNKNWGNHKVPSVPTAVPTQWELTTRRLGTTDPHNVELRCWVRKHYRSRYVPEPVLKALGLDLDTDDFSLYGARLPVAEAPARCG